VHRTTGFQEAEEFIATGKQALDPTKNLSAFTKKYAEGERSPEFLRAYAYASRDAMDVKYRNIVTQYLEGQEDWSSPENMKFIFDFTENTHSRHFNYMVENRQLFEKALGTSEVFGKIQSVVQDRLDQIMNQKSNAVNEFKEIDKLLQKVYKEEAAVKFAAFKMTFYRTQGDRDGFAEAAVEYVTYMKNITADELNSIARTFAEVIEDKEMLKKAVEWSQRAVAMEDTHSHRYTLAVLYFKIGETGKAKKTAKKAIQLAKKQGEDFAHVETLLAEMKK
jgi:tetratricopeptide (TPR) repeat protein